MPKFCINDVTLWCSVRWNKTSMFIAQFILSMGVNCALIIGLRSAWSSRVKATQNYGRTISHISTKFCAAQERHKISDVWCRWGLPKSAKFLTSPDRMRFMAPRYRPLHRIWKHEKKVFRSQRRWGWLAPSAPASWFVVLLAASDYVYHFVLCLQAENKHLAELASFDLWACGAWWCVCRNFSGRPLTTLERECTLAFVVRTIGKWLCSRVCFKAYKA